MPIYSVRQDRENDLVYRAVDQFPSRLQSVLRSGMLQYLRAVKKQADFDVLHKEKHGQVYWVRGRGGRLRRHQASAPGESHANLTGRLRRSIGWKVHGWQRGEFGYGVSSTTENVAPFYAPFLELGTRVMRPRPTLRNAVEETEMTPHFELAFDREFSK